MGYKTATDFRAARIISDQTWHPVPHEHSPLAGSTKDWTVSGKVETLQWSPACRAQCAQVSKIQRCGFHQKLLAGAGLSLPSFLPSIPSSLIPLLTAFFHLDPNMLVSWKWVFLSHYKLIWSKAIEFWIQSIKKNRIVIIYIYVLFLFLCLVDVKS